MTTKIKQSDLLTVLTKALPGIEKGNSLIEGADTFVFNGETGSVRTFNDNISVCVTSTALMGLSGALKATDFWRAVKKFTASEIEIETSEDAWKLKCGRAKSTLTRFQDSISEFLKDIDSDVSEWAPLPADFLDALRLCFIAGNKVAKRGLYLEDGVLFSTDGKILNRYVFDRLEDGPSIGDLYLDDPAIKELLKLGNLNEINIGTGWVHFRSESDIVFSAKLKDRTDYPLGGISQYFALADDEIPTLKAVLSSGLAKAADRVGVFETEREGVSAIEFTLSSEAILLSSKRVSGGTEEDVPWDTPVKLDTPISALVDPFFLIEASAKAPNISVVSVGESPILIFSSDKFTQIGSTRSREG